MRMASFLPPRWWGVDGVPSTPDGVLNEWVIRVPGGNVDPGPIESSDIVRCAGSKFGADSAPPFLLAAVYYSLIGK